MKNTKSQQKSIKLKPPVNQLSHTSNNLMVQGPQPNFKKEVYADSLKSQKAAVDLDKFL